MESGIRGLGRGADAPRCAVRGGFRRSRVTAPWVDFGISAALFVDCPSERADPYCEQKSEGLAGHAVYRMRNRVAVRDSFGPRDG